MLSTSKSAPSRIRKNGPSQTMSRKALLGRVQQVPINGNVRELAAVDVSDSELQTNDANSNALMEPVES